MSIEAMKLALEALEWFTAAEQGDEPPINQAITALRQAIEQASENGLYREGYRNGYGFGEAAGLRQAIEQAQKQEEPVAWMHWLHGPVRLFLNKDEAMMELDRLNREYPVDADGRKMRPLVFGDTSPPQRQPLTDEQIYEICASLGMAQLSPIEVARAIEAAHGITGEKE